MRLFSLVLLRSPLGPQPGRFPVETLPLGNSDDLLPGVPRPGLYRSFKARHPPLQIGQVLLDQLRAHALSMPFRNGPRNCCDTSELLSYMKLLDVPIGLLINFHEMKVTDGISRLILPGANL